MGELFLFRQRQLQTAVGAIERVPRRSPEIYGVNSLALRQHVRPVPPAPLTGANER